MAVDVYREVRRGRAGGVRGEGDREGGMLIM